VKKLSSDTVALAALALERSVAGEYDEAGEAVNQIAEQHGSDGVIGAMALWAEAVVGMTWGEFKREDVTLSMLNVACGHVHEIDDVPYGPRWAGRWVAAVAARDENNAQALLHTAAADERVEECVMATLICAGSTIRTFRELGP
jgi:hypothetical protein